MEQTARQCLYCGAKLHQKRWPSGKLEQPSHLAVRNHCGRQCAARARSKVRPKWSRAVAPQWTKARSGPLNEYERIAAETYRARGIAYEWVPAGAPYDCLVNGLRVDIKGAIIGPGGFARYHLPYGSPQEHSRFVSRRGSERCDYFHLIAMEMPEPRHYVIPASLLDTMTCMALPIGLGRRSKWNVFIDQWGLLEDGVSRQWREAP